MASSSAPSCNFATSAAFMFSFASLRRMRQLVILTFCIAPVQSTFPVMAPTLSVCRYCSGCYCSTVPYL